MIVLPSVEEVMAKYMQSIGSADAIQKASTLVETGTVELEIPPPAGAPAGPPKIGRVDAEIDRKAPDKVLYQVHFPAGVNGMSTEGYDGATSWLTAGGVREIAGTERTVMKQRAEFFPLQHFKDTHSRLTVEAVEPAATAGHIGSVASGKTV